MSRPLFADEHDQFRRVAHRFVANEIVPNFEKWETEGIIDRALFAKAGELGLLGMAVPEDLGGGGVDDFRYNVIVNEEIHLAGCNGVGLGVALHNDIVLPYFLTYCSEEQRRRWLPGIASGELITAIAMTEPGIGSDLASMSTTAIRHGEVYVVNGSKTFITNGINADLVVTAVKTDPSQRHRGMSLLVLERGMEGFERGRNLEKLGMHSQDTAELFFDDVAVPVENRLGIEGEGFGYLVQNLPQERLSLAVSAVAAARHAFALTLEYCGQRTAFGQTIGSFQNTRFVLAELATQIEVAEVVHRHLRGRAGPRRAHGRSGGHGQVVVHRAAVADGRPRAATARRLRVHARVPHLPRLCRRPDHLHLWRHHRDHEGNHRSGAGPVTTFRPSPAG